MSWRKLIVSGDVNSIMGVMTVRKVRMRSIRHDVAMQRPTHRSASLMCTYIVTEVDHSVHRVALTLRRMGAGRLRASASTRVHSTGLLVLYRGLATVLVVPPRLAPIAHEPPAMAEVGRG